jgi:long-chain acyl-CoA synthetase
VGGPVVVNEFKLVDCPDLGYTNKDKDEQGNPLPRGELWVRGPNVIPGYFKLDEKNKETFTEDGWL